jgi:hypothetical protein
MGLWRRGGGHPQPNKSCSRPPLNQTVQCLSTPAAQEAIVWRTKCRDDSREAYPLLVACVTQTTDMASGWCNVHMCAKTVRILLVNLLQSSRSTFSRGNLLSFFAFKEGMLGTPSSVLGGWPTVSVSISHTIYAHREPCKIKDSCCVHKS